MTNVLTIRESVKRARDEGMPISEYTLRQWVRNGVIPARKAGAKTLIFYPNLVRYLRCEADTDNAAATVIPSGIRRIDL